MGHYRVTPEPSLEYSITRGTILCSFLARCCLRTSLSQFSHSLMAQRVVKMATRRGGVSWNDDTPAEDSCDQYTINLGFLQLHRTYSVLHSVPVVGGATTHAGAISIRPPIDDQLVVRLVPPDELPTSHDHECATVVQLVLHTTRPGIYEEGFTVIVSSPHAELPFVVRAKVLARGAGTPMLKPAVKCVGIDPDAESDVDSDWQGFE